MNLYVVLDRVAEESGPVFEARNDGVAYRNFQQVLAKADGATPADFELLRLGRIDHTTQVVQLEAYPVVVDRPIESLEVVK